MPRRRRKAPPREPKPWPGRTDALVNAALSMRAKMQELNFGDGTLFRVGFPITEEERQALEEHGFTVEELLTVDTGRDR